MSDRYRDEHAPQMPTSRPSTPSERLEAMRKIGDRAFQTLLTNGADKDARIAALERERGVMKEALADLAERAERCQGILREQSDGGQWHMLDTDKARAALKLANGEAGR